MREYTQLWRRYSCIHIPDSNPIDFNFRNFALQQSPSCSRMRRRMRLRAWRTEWGEICSSATTTAVGMLSTTERQNARQVFTSTLDSTCSIARRTNSDRSRTSVGSASSNSVAFLASASSLRLMLPPMAGTTLNQGIFVGVLTILFFQKNLGMALDWR